LKRLKSASQECTLVAGRRSPASRGTRDPGTSLTAGSPRVAENRDPGPVGRPTLASVVFRDIEALLIACGCERDEGVGSRVAFIRGSLRLYLHRPHPGKEARRYQVESVREFPEELDIGP
jgi:hypothetical protein